MNDPNDNEAPLVYYDLGYNDNDRERVQFCVDAPKGVQLDGAYSDRMYSWDFKKFNAACKEVWGDESQYFDPPRRTPLQIEKFLTAYRGKPTKLVRIIRYVHAAHGFPLWYFEYYTPSAA